MQLFYMETIGLHHIKNLKDIFIELDRLLNNNGVLIISEP